MSSFHVFDQFSMMKVAETLINITKGKDYTRCPLCFVTAVMLDSRISLRSLLISVHPTESFGRLQQPLVSNGGCTG